MPLFELQTKLAAFRGALLLPGRMAERQMTGILTWISGRHFLKSWPVSPPLQRK